MPTALILGASGTLGGAIARDLIARGYAVGLHYHTQADTCAALAAEAQAKGQQAVCYAADLSTPDAPVPQASGLPSGSPLPREGEGLGVRGPSAGPQASGLLGPATLAASFLKDFQRVDALIWAAGIVRDAPLLTLKEEDLRAVLNTDARAVFLLLKAFSRQFIKQKSGCVIALSSHAGLSGRAGGTAYAMAQSALVALLKSAAREFGPLGVRVNAVLPPFVPDSGMGKLASPEFAAAAKAKRVLKPDTDGARAVAQMVISLLENPAVSGQVVAADSRLL